MAKDNANTFPSRRAVAALLASASAIPLTAVPALPALATEPDPIFAAIERHGYVRDAYIVAMRELHDDPDRQEEYEEHIDNYDDACLSLVTTRPTTLAGVVAVLTYVAAPEWPREDQSLLEGIAESSDEALADASRGFVLLIADVLKQLTAAAS
jgi:hypothetical protein